MKEFFRRVSPIRAVKDFVGVWRQQTNHRWSVAGVSVALTFCLFMLFIPESQRIKPQPPDVIWITTWEEDRTEEQIMASNCGNQQLIEEREELLARRAEIRRDMYSAIGRATGVDVDEMADEARIERERAEREAEEARAQLAELERAQQQVALCERLNG